MRSQGRDLNVQRQKSELVLYEDRCKFSVGLRGWSRLKKQFRDDELQTTAVAMETDGDGSRKKQPCNLVVESQRGGSVREQRC